MTNGIPKDYSGKVRLLSSNGSVIFNGTMEKSALTGKGMLYDYCGNILYEGDFENQLYNGDGISYYGKSSTAYIDNKSDELYICDVGKNSKGTYWAKVSYPIGSKRAYAYIALSAITDNNGSHVKTAATGKFYCSYRKGVVASSSYYVSKGDTVYLIATSGSSYQILYPVSGGKWRIGWCSKTDYNKYCASSNSFSPVWPCQKSNYISTMYRYYNSGNPKNHSVRSNIYNAFDIAGSSGDAICY